MNFINDKPLVSVIILCYNQSGIIGRAIESVLNQTYPNIQIILLDDCSIDNSKGVILEWEKKYPEKIKTFFQPANVGHPANMNTGYKMCEGELITFCDGDDWYFPEKVEQEVNCLKANSEADVVYSNFDFYTIDGMFLKHWAIKESAIPNGDIFLQLFSLQFPYKSHLRYEMTSKKIVKEIGYYDETIPIWVDWDFRLRLAAKYKFAYCHYVGSAYTENPGGLTNVLKQETILKSLLCVIEKNKHTLDKYPLTAKKRALRTINLSVQKQQLAVSMQKGQTSFFRTIGFLLKYPEEIRNFRFIISSMFGTGIIRFLSSIKQGIKQPMADRL